MLDATGLEVKELCRSYHRPTRLLECDRRKHNRCLESESVAGQLGLIVRNCRLRRMPPLRCLPKYYPHQHIAPSCEGFRAWRNNAKQVYQTSENFKRECRVPGIACAEDEQDEEEQKRILV